MIPSRRNKCDEMDEIPIDGDGLVPGQEILRRSLHDMGSPLSAMRVLLELLRLTGSCPGKRNELVGMLDLQVTDLAERLEGLLKELGPVDFE